MDRREQPDHEATKPDRTAPKAASAVADDIRARIARKDLVEGDPLPNETLLMERYGVSRPTVRAALRILESESLIAVKMGAGGGPRVTIPSVDILAQQFSLHLQLHDTTLRDVFHARSVLEPAAVRELALRRPRGALRRLRDAHQAEVEALGDPAAIAKAAAHFHEQLVELAGNQTLSLVAQLLQHMVAEQNLSTLGRHQRRDHLLHSGMSTHDELLALIEAGDADAAEQLWSEHMAEAARAALKANGTAARLDLFSRDQPDSPRRTT